MHAKQKRKIVRWGVTPIGLGLVADVFLPLELLRTLRTARMDGITDVVIIPVLHVGIYWILGGCLLIAGLSVSQFMMWWLKD